MQDPSALGALQPQKELNEKGPKTGQSHQPSSCIQWTPLASSSAAFKHLLAWTHFLLSSVHLSPLQPKHNVCRGSTRFLSEPGSQQQVGLD